MNGPLSDKFTPFYIIFPSIFKMLAVTRTLDKTIYFGVVLSKVSIIAKENDIKEVKFVRKWGGGTFIC